MGSLGEAERKLITLGLSTIERTEFGCVTRFDDGAFVNSVPHPQDPHYHVIAHRCGYEDDLHAYTYEHDFCHLFLMERLHGIASPVLWALAHGQDVPENSQIFEEMASQVFQRYLRANEQPIIGGVDWGKLKREALNLLG